MNANTDKAQNSPDLIDKAEAIGTTPDETKRSQIQAEIIEVYTSASPAKQRMIFALVEAYCCDEIETIEAILADPSTTEAEAEIIRPTIAKLRASLSEARFQPVFTYQQIQEVEKTQQPSRDMRRRLVLSVLTMTEKRMTRAAEDDLDAYADLVEQASACVDESKQLLELAQAALSRLFLVGADFVEVQA
jgi:hypothetical protein